MVECGGDSESEMGSRQRDERQNGDVDIVTKQLVGVVDNSMDPDIEVRIALTLTTPAHASGPVPVIMQYGAAFGAGGGRGAESAGPPFGPNAFAALPQAEGPCR